MEVHRGREPAACARGGLSAGGRLHAHHGIQEAAGAGKAGQQLRGGIPAALPGRGEAGAVLPRSHGGKPAAVRAVCGAGCSDSQSHSLRPPGRFQVLQHGSGAGAGAACVREIKKITKRREA